MSIRPKIRTLGQERPGLQFPIVTCERHPPEPGYVACVHVADQGKPVAEIIAPTADNVGQILCADGEHSDAKDAILVCAACARARGWLVTREDL